MPAATKDGELRQFEILYTNLLDDDAVRGIVLNGRDVSERKEFEEQLAHQAFHDPVTDLANRALFVERVRHAVARALREGSGIVRRLRRPRRLQDRQRQPRPRRRRRGAASRSPSGLATSIRASDTAARFGGDEFAILLEDVDDAAGGGRDRRADPGGAGPPAARSTTRRSSIRASLGISVAEPGNPTDADELIRNADAAMYIAKRDGKGGYRLFEPAMHEQVMARLELRADLQRALDRDEFELHYQPVVRLRDGAVTGVEALLRWRHPDARAGPARRLHPASPRRAG